MGIKQRRIHNVVIGGCNLKGLKQNDLRFYKEELLEAGKYRDKRDLISALLADGREYSMPEADAMIEKFMKGKVK